MSYKRNFSAEEVSWTAVETVMMWRLQQKQRDRTVRARMEVTPTAVLLTGVVEEATVETRT